MTSFVNLNRCLSRRGLLGIGAAGGTGMLIADPGPAAAQTPTGTVSPTAVQTGNYAAAPGDFVPVDASGGSVTVTLPAQPSDGTEVGVETIALTGPNAVTLTCGAHDALDRAMGDRSLTLTAVNQMVLLRYQATTKIWYRLAQNLLTPVVSGGSAGSYALVVKNYSNAVALKMQTDWSANLTGTNTYDSLDIYHKSNGDGVFVVHGGGVPQALLNIGTVAGNNGITYVQNAYLPGSAANAVSVAHTVSGFNTALNVLASESTVAVTVATDSAGNAVSTSAEVIAAVNASPQAKALVFATPLVDSTGTSSGAGIVASLAATNLSGGYLGTRSGANSALNAYIPFWLDDVGSGQGRSSTAVMARRD